MASDNPDKPLLQGDDIRLEFDFSREIAEMSPEIEGMAAIQIASKTNGSRMLIFVFYRCSKLQGADQFYIGKYTL